MDRESYEFGLTWNRFIRTLEKAETFWDQFQEKLLVLNQEQLENLPISVQKAAARYKRAKFTVMLPRFVDFWRGYGGLGELIAVLEKPEEKKEKED